MSLHSKGFIAKEAALANLKDALATKQARNESSRGLGGYALPANSRDGSQTIVSSRYFSANNTNFGKVLVPSSSPIVPSPPRRKNQALHDVAGGPYNLFQDDMLVGSSGFTVNGVPATDKLGSNRRPRESSLDSEEGPPRKRVHTSTTGLLDFTASPVSPQVGRAPKRRFVGDDEPSDEDLPENLTLAGPSKPRLTRDRPAAAPPPPPPPSDLDDVAFTRFKLTQPTHSPVRIRAAWDQSGQNVKVATDMLEDSNWTPNPIPSSDSVGRVTEVDEASKAQRAATKAKGQQSAIYANRQPRPAEENKLQFRHYTGPKVKAGSNGPSNAPSPEPTTLPRRRVARKLVFDSDSDGAYSDGGERDESDRVTDLHRARTLSYFNSSSEGALQELTGCTPEQATKIVSLRPFETAEDLQTKLKQLAKKKSGLSTKLFDDCTAIFQGYGSVDSVLEECEHIGDSLRSSISKWSSTSGEAALGEQLEDGALSLRHVDLSGSKQKNYLSSQPKLIAPDVQLKEYQLLGVNWLNLLYTSDLSCILADEMGLGKTIQVISFFAHLKAQGNKGPHLVIVPSSTLENWCREFARFVPSIAIQTYYAGKEERPELRETLLDTQRSRSRNDEGWEVLITTYTLAQGDERDRKFFRKIQWDCCVFDEGHVLKNFQSQRYQSLLKFGSKWRLLLTGTPLQNNLQELVSLMNFILPEQFSTSMGSLRAIFKVKGDSKVSLLSQERVSRAKKMMTPFVLRRRKDQVLKDLPKKTERIEWCELTDLQKSIYTDALQRSRKFVLETADPSSRESSAPAPTKKKTKPAAKKTYLENSSNVLMDLRKGALHPMLFRTEFTLDILSSMTKELLKEPDFKKRGAVFDLVKEDMSVMTDSELQYFCGTYKSIRKYRRDDSCYLNSGKVQALLRLLAEYKEQKRKVLVFSQFTQVLDIIQAILKIQDIEFLILTGATPVDVRQSLVDEFSERDDLDVFLLSTKAGGMGINLTAASVVIMFDQDFNPHNDRQAQDRAYRIGQQRDVEVIKLITRGTIEEDMLRLGETKLALDEAVAGDSEEGRDGESAPEREMKQSLLASLREQFKAEA
ncbi:SNF2 family DNA-dependent ATPase [Mycena indigotica]|uniref:DNA helicase n=1 Tax=Mycena indigotica TaxID=2126181 RepID=A0A8H6WKC7_9AGAR|nr:SNF2 family DNA-dependent ATPase [Mycena indigotica]KAF7315594.1 SNF2 family DNA-dependent ATPase [Mycena indigotica]